MRELRLLVNQEAHNFQLMKMYSGLTNQKINEKAEELHDNFTMEIGRFVDLSALSEGFMPAVKKFTRCAGEVRRAEEDQRKSKQDQLEEAHICVLLEINKMMRRVNKHLSPWPWVRSHVRFREWQHRRR